MYILLRRFHRIPNTYQLPNRRYVVKDVRYFYMNYFKTALIFHEQNSKEINQYLYIE